MKQLLPGLVLLASALGTYGQSFNSDQIYSSPISHNPAFTGYSGGSRVVGQYRYVFDDPPDNPWYNDNTHDNQYSFSWKPSYIAFLKDAGIEDFRDHPTSFSVRYQFTTKEGMHQLKITPLLPY